MIISWLGLTSMDVPIHSHSQQQATRSQNVKSLFNCFLATRRPCGVKEALLGQIVGWQTWLAEMFPSGYVLCNSLDTHSGQMKAVWVSRKTLELIDPKRSTKIDLVTYIDYVVKWCEFSTNDVSIEMFSELYYFVASTVACFHLATCEQTFRVKHCQYEQEKPSSQMFTFICSFSCHHGILFSQPFCPHKLSHKLSSVLGKRCDPLEKKEMLHCPTSSDPSMVLSWHCHGHFYYPCSCPSLEVWRAKMWHKLKFSIHSRSQPRIIFFFSLVLLTRGKKFSGSSKFKP